MRIISGIFVAVSLIIFLNCAGSPYTLTPEAQGIIARLDSMKASGNLELMAGTEYQTPAFIFDAPREGPHVIILGGTHGDEPAGYEAALRLVKRFSQVPPAAGRIIIIPLANRKAVENFNRRVPVPPDIDRERGNLNRCYPGKPDGYPMEQMAYAIQQLAIENNVDVFIDLHEARKPHLENDPESERKSLGQTIIYHPNEASAGLLIVMLDEINAGIKDENKRFSALERPIKNSAAWWAGRYLDCAAFTFETPRSMPIEQRINYHLSLVDIVLREKGML
jgi:hypothetical protein